MDLSSILFAIIMILGATAACVILFERLGFGSVLGFIVAGILIGPHTPGPVASAQVKEIQHIAEIGVVLFMFIVGLEMRPTKVWAMRRLMFGLGTAQWLGTAILIGVYAFFFGENLSWASALVLGLGLAMASTAIIMTTLTERGELSSEHGRTSFAILMAQDLWIVPAMALIPLLAQKKSDMPAIDAWEQGLLVFGVLAGIFIVGRYVLPAVLGYTARRRRMDAFAIALFLAIISAAWMVEHVGISMTLGAFVMGMLLSASDHRYQIEATVGPFKDTLMGLFFLAVGMSIDVGALINDWSTLFTHLSVIIAIKVVAAIIVTSNNPKRAEGLAITLQRRYPKTNVYARVRTLADQDRLRARGIKHAGTGYIEGTLARGRGVLMDLGVSEDDASALVDSFQQDNYALVRAAYVDTKER